MKKIAIDKKTNKREKLVVKKSVVRPLDGNTLEQVGGGFYPLTHCQTCTCP